MEEIQSQIDKEQAVANKKKAMVPNFARLLANLIILFFVPSDLHFFKNILRVNSACGSKNFNCLKSCGQKA